MYIAKSLGHRQGPRNRKAMWGMCPPIPPPILLKVKKVPFFWPKVPHLKNEKSLS